MNRFLTPVAIAVAGLALLATVQAPSASTIPAANPSRAGYPDLPPCSDAQVVFTECDLLLHLDKWRRKDGLIGFYLSDYFVDFAATDPPVFFEVMAQHRDSFDEWLADLPNRSFHDMGTCLEDRECMRLGLLESIQGFLNQLDGDERDLAEALIRRLNEIEVTSVD